MITVGIVGVTGRIGQSLVHHLSSHPRLKAAIGYSSRSDTVSATSSIPITTSTSKVFERADVVVDFSHPDAINTYAADARSAKKPLVVGTSGLSPAHEQHLRHIAQTSPVVYAANTSMGITLLLDLVQKVAKNLSSDLFDIEILETHHRHKIDAPSGTALALGKAAAKGRGVDFDHVAQLQRQGTTGARPSGAIGISALRGGNIVGEHTVRFMGETEEILLSHRSFSKDIYAQGALKAIEWALQSPPGLYTMTDVLGK